MGQPLHDFFASHLGRAVTEWLKAEVEVNPAIERMAIGDRLALAVPRVTAVFAGEVRWSEASPGDRAVWVGRSRNLEHHETQDDYYKYYWENLWDTRRIGEGAEDPHVYHRWSDSNQGHGWARMFSNLNIGMWSLCNLQVGGQLVGDHQMMIGQMYATINRALEPNEHVVATLEIGNKIVSQATLPDLIVGCPVGQSLLERQGYSVMLMWERIKRPLSVVVHLEGPSRRALM